MPVQIRKNSATLRWLRSTQCFATSFPSYARRKPSRSSNVPLPSTCGGQSFLCPNLSRTKLRLIRLSTASASSSKRQFDSISSTWRLMFMRSSRYRTRPLKHRHLTREPTEHQPTALRTLGTRSRSLRKHVTLKIAGWRGCDISHTMTSNTGSRRHLLNVPGSLLIRPT